MKTYIYLILIGFSIISCNSNRRPKFHQRVKYKEYKGEFDKKLTKHFPDKLTTYPYGIIRATNMVKNDVCFMLCEYDIEKNKLDSIIKRIQNIAIAKYKSNDSCLLIVNRFETIESYENRKKVEITDTTKVNQDCFKKLYPIPNFINYHSTNGNADSKLTDDFNFYVLEAESGNYWKKYNLLPNPQMPDGWKNGYSRGVAISKEKRDVIYWAIVW
jgi:hypothetical protein